MAIFRLSRGVVGAVALVASAGLLVGCGEAAPPADVPSGDFSDLTLAESKSPAQLIRNTAVLRIPDAVVSSVGESVDSSIACLSEEDDPEGYIRQWRSVVDVELLPTNAQSTQIILDGVVSSFTDEGWLAQRVAGTAANNFGHQLMNSGAGAALVDSAQLQLEGIVSGDGSSGSIHVVGLGPCVTTAGKDSDEVTNLDQP